MLIDTPDKLEALKPELLACVDPCVDTETTGLCIFGNSNQERDKIIGIAIDTGVDAYYFPFRHSDGKNLPIECMEFFSSYLSNPSRTYKGFNYGYDLHMMAMDGIEIAPKFEDAMIGVHLLNENEESFRLKSLCDKYGLGDGSLQESVLEDKVYAKCQELGLQCSRSRNSRYNTKSMMHVLEPKDVEPYACDDVRLTRMLLNVVEEALEAYGMTELFRQVCMYSYITVLMEHHGMKVDKDTVKRYMDESKVMSDIAVQKLRDAAGFEINPNSSKQVCGFLGVQSSSAEVLTNVIDAGGVAAENAKMVQEARGWLSVGNRYYTPYLECMDANDTIHCNLNLIGTVSGRLSCSNPNLQAVARHTDVFKVKDVFVARDGYTMIQADYKQAEMRLVTFYTQDPTMMNLIESDADLHTATAELLGIPRNAAKRINFSVVYGIGYKHLASNLRIEEPIAKDYLDRYHALYPGFKKLMYKCEDMAKKDGFIAMWTGRMRHFNVPEADPHKAMSNLIQGGVAEVVRVAITRLFPAITDLGGRMLLQVHDSIMFEVPDDKLNVALPTIKYIMEDFDFRPKMGVDIEYGKSWGTFKKWDGSDVQQ